LLHPEVGPFADFAYRCRARLGRARVDLGAGFMEDRRGQIVAPTGLNRGPLDLDVEPKIDLTLLQPGAVADDGVSPLAS
jgi:hypothetical protein